MLITTFSHLILPMKPSHILAHSMIQSGVDQKTAQLNEPFSGVTLYQIKLLLHSLWNCVVVNVSHTRKFSEVFPHDIHANRKIFCTNKPFHFQQFEFDTFRTICVWCTVSKISAEMEFNTCCHTFVWCTLPCILWTLIVLRLIVCVRGDDVVCACGNEEFNFESVNWCIRYAKWEWKKCIVSLAVHVVPLWNFSCWGGKWLCVMHIVSDIVICYVRRT